MNRFQLIVAGVLFSLTITTYAKNNATLTVSAAIVATTDFYKDYRQNIAFFPIISYQMECFEINNLAVSYHLWNDQQNQLSITSNYSPLQFKPRKTDSPALKQLNKRKETIMAGVAYQHVEHWGIIRTALSADILGNSKGILADIAYLQLFHKGHWRFSPSFGILWGSKYQNQYYLGISKQESFRSGLASYRSNDSWSPYVNMSASYGITEHWSNSFSIRYTKFGHAISDSPMVERNDNIVATAAISYRF